MGFLLEAAYNQWSMHSESGKTEIEQPQTRTLIGQTEDLKKKMNKVVNAI